jgi:hypothetical protein
MGIQEGKEKFKIGQNPATRAYMYRGRGKPSENAPKTAGLRQQRQLEMMARVDAIAATGVCGACAGEGKIFARVPLIKGKRDWRTCLGCSGTGTYPQK